jgi:diaminopimelate decarboxylase
MHGIMPERTKMNNDLMYQGSDLMLDRLPLASIAREYGTPVYVYSASSIRRQAARLMQSLGTIGSLRYAVKANANPVLLALVFSMGIGADTVSRGEIQDALGAGCPADRIVFSGVGKTHEELSFALDRGIFINAESEEELAAIAHLRTGAHVGVRINPGVDAHTHQYITTGTEQDKFGIPIDAAPDAFRLALDAGLVPDTISCHIGSQITSLEPYRKALARLLALRDSCPVPQTLCQDVCGRGRWHERPHSSSAVPGASCDPPGDPEGCGANPVRYRRPRLRVRRLLRPGHPHAAS